MDHDAKIRPLYIAKLLAEFTDEEHYLTTVQIQQLLKKRYGMDAYRRTIPGDIQILKEFGLDIQETRSTQNRYNLLSRTFDTAELKLLIDAVLSARFISKKRSEELAAKLAGLESTVKGRQLTRHVSVENRVKSGNEKIYLIIDAVNEAIRTGRKISFRYFHYNMKLERVYIPQSVTTISSDAFEGAPDGLVIAGVKGSKAEAFAKQKGYTFKAQ